MRIERFFDESLPGARRVGAHVVWEDAPRPPQRVFFEARDPFARDLAPDPHALLLAAAIPALRAGEARLRVDAPLCPRLEAGLLAAMRTLCAWYEPGRRLPRIEPDASARAARRPVPARRALFLSGGVDSLGLLRSQRLALPASDPQAFRDAFFVDGFDIDSDGGDAQQAFFERACRSLAPAARDAGVDLVCLRTNLRCLDRSPESWPQEWCGAAAAAVAHAFGRRVDRVEIAASMVRSDQVRAGTHPELDPLYSSGDVEILHAGGELRRIQKLALVADWQQGFAALRVCWKGVHPEGPLNCSRCHKCVMTMLALVALGRLADSPTFASGDVTPALTNALRVDTPTSMGFYRELIEPLRARGRGDLADALAHKLRIHERLQGWKSEPTWLRRLRGRSDRRLERRARRLARVSPDAAL